MSPLVNVLLLEDDVTDAMLIRRALAQQLPEAEVVHAATAEAFRERLASRERIDIVLSDGGVPGCEGLKAFHMARGARANVAFLRISGTMIPDRDVRGLEALGVSGFVCKSDLAQLGARIRQAIEKTERVPAGDARHLAGYEHLVTVIQHLSLARDLETIMLIVRSAARRLTGADGATFVLRDGDLCHYADEDAIGPLWKGRKFPLESCISGWAMMNRQPAVVEDIYTDSRIPIAAYEPTFVRSVVMVPIRALDPIGAIGNYWAKRRVPDPREVRLLQALADTTAVAMENVRIYGGLETRVRERTAELEAFTYAISHDLRAPVRHVSAITSILAEDYRHKLDEGFSLRLEQLGAAALHMRKMIDGLLELSAMTQARVRREAVDLARLGASVADECRLAGGPEVEFIAPETLPAVGDPTLLKVVLQNLIGNAWKFSAKQAAPKVELGMQTDDTGHPVYFVRDNGAGFDAAEVAQRLFQVFQRFHRQEEFAGTGVGLATVQRIVHKHGGRVWAASQPGEGATFYFTLAGETSSAQ